LYVNTPIITGSDAEGAGEMFKVTALPFDNTPRTEEGKVNYKEDFLEKTNNGFWTIRGETLQWLWVRFTLDLRLEQRILTSRHLAEFWMIEPEVAFNDLNGSG
jgi:asparaginyl-tRNA synthetase